MGKGLLCLQQVGVGGGEKACFLLLHFIQCPSVSPYSPLFCNFLCHLVSIFLLFAWRWLKCPTVADKIAQHKKTLFIWEDYTVQKVWAESKLASAMKDQELDVRWCFQVVRYLSWVKPVLPSAPERLHFSTLSQIYWHWKKTVVCALDHDWQRKFLEAIRVPCFSPCSIVYWVEEWSQNTFTNSCEEVLQRNLEPNKPLRTKWVWLHTHTHRGPHQHCGHFFRLGKGFLNQKKNPLLDKMGRTKHTDRSPHQHFRLRKGFLNHKT